MDPQKRIIDAISEIAKSRAGMRAYERQLETASAIWLERLINSVSQAVDESEFNDIIIELSSVIETLLSVPGTPYGTMLTGKALSQLIDVERSMGKSRMIMRRLLSQETADKADHDLKRLLVVNTAIGSTKVSIFEGLTKIIDYEVHLSPDMNDSIDSRVDSITSWLADEKIPLSSFDGIACRCGFIQPVPTGTYRIVSEMLQDLENPRIAHAANPAIPITFRLAALSGREDSMLLTTSDPVVSDEIDTVERITGTIDIKRDGSGAHYLNHKAVHLLISSLLGRNSHEVSAVTAHLGNGISLALHRENRVMAVVDAFSGLPTTHRCGPLDLPRLIDAMKNDEMNLKELEAITFTRGGLLSLAGTDDFRTLEAFRYKGATVDQQKKIELLFDFFARQITQAALKLTADGKPVNVMALTGGLARSGELVRRIEDNIGGRYPIVLIPGAFEHESLAAGLIRGFYEPESLKDYVRERDALHASRTRENELMDTVIFDRKVKYRKKDAPIVSMDELIDATRIVVKEHFTPSIAIVGADNEEAILAAKRANEEGSYRIAKFHLVGDFAAINQLAYEYDLIIDNDNYTIHDTDNPIEEATRLIAQGKAHILMKGSIGSADILRGVFHFLKDTGRLKSGELISHIFVMDIPVRNKLLLISDAAVNTYPNEDKRIKIIENTLKVAANLNIKKPKVAVISAIEKVNKSIESSIEAERIARHFDGRNDCIVEGPLSFDVAMDQKIAQEKRYKGQIVGTADILAMPDIDAGNVLYKSLTTQSGATSAGVILCGDMPMVLTSRGDSARSKLASISLAVKLFFGLHEPADQKVTSLQD